MEYLILFLIIGVVSTIFSSKENQKNRRRHPRPVARPFPEDPPGKEWAAPPPHPRHSSPPPAGKPVIPVRRPAVRTAPAGGGSPGGWVRHEGLPGVQGVKGDEGRRGTEGFTGSEGTAGSQGIAGHEGLQGTQGTVGHEGLAGREGAPPRDVAAAATAAGLPKPKSKVTELLQPENIASGMILKELLGPPRSKNPIR